MRMKKHSRLGFTLVELIVVIAILAILAGVAIPVYSSYIKKANEAADLQLLDAMNTAFAAACQEYLVDRTQLTGVVPIISDGCIIGLSVGSIPASAIMVRAVAPQGGMAMLGARSHMIAASVSGAKINTAFLTYFGDNVRTSLKFYKVVRYDPQKGAFGGVDPSDASGASGGAVMTSAPVHEGGTTTTTFMLADGTEVSYVVEDEALENFQESTFMDIGVSDLMGDVTGMVDAMATALGGGSMLAGILTDDTHTLEDWGITAEAGTEEYLNQLANAAVLYVANNTDSSTTDSLMHALSTGDLNSVMTLENGAGALLANMAGLYGIATGFASSDAASDWSFTVGETTFDSNQYYDYVNSQIVAAASSNKPQGEKLNDIMNALGMMTAFVYNDPTDTSQGMTEAFTSYASAAEGETSQLSSDVSGYVSAMITIASNSDSLITSGATSNGYGTGSIADILNAIFGSVY